jgi:uncharacterized membrane protein required for colicin V production
MSAATATPMIASIVDISALTIILLDAYFGFRRGLSGEAARFFALVLGVALTLLLLHPIGSLVFRYASPVIPEASRHAFAFVSTTLAAAVIAMIVHRPIYNWLDANSPKHHNKFGGLVAGLMRGFIGVMLVLIVLNLWPSPAVQGIFNAPSVSGKVTGKVVPVIKRRLGSQGWVSESSGAGKEFLKVLRKEKDERSSVSK